MTVSAHVDVQALGRGMWWVSEGLRTQHPSLRGLRGKTSQKMGKPSSTCFSKQAQVTGPGGPMAEPQNNRRAHPTLGVLGLAGHSPWVMGGQA